MFVTNATGSITSPGYPDGYANSLDCQWNFIAPEGHRIWFNFTDVDMQYFYRICIVDYVKFEEGRQVPQTLDGQLSLCEAAPFTKKHHS